MTQKLNLGRVQGVSIFYSLADYNQNLLLNQILPNDITPLAGDYILFSNGNVHQITQVSANSVTCGDKLFSLKGEKGFGLANVEQTQSTQSGGTNLVKFFLHDGSSVDVQIKNGIDGKDGVNGKDGIEGKNGIDGKNGVDGTNGKDGTSVGIVSASVEYQASANGTTPPSGSWSQSIPNVSNGQYLWTKTAVVYTNGNSTTTFSVGYIGLNGTNGIDGKDGVNGKDGTSIVSASVIKLGSDGND